MFLKRLFIISLLLILAAAVSACSTFTDTVTGSKGNEKNVEIKLGDIEYEIPPEIVRAEEGKLGLKIDFSFENKGDESVRVDESDFELYSNGTELEGYDPENEKEEFNSTTVAAGKKINGSLFYVVDKGEKFEFIYIVQPFIEGVWEEKKIEFEIDGNDEKLLKTAKKLQKPEKALQAYIDLFFYGKDNPDFEKLTGETREENLKQFEEGLKKGVTGPTVSKETDEEAISNFVSAMRSEMKERVPVKLVTKSLSKDIAIVAITGKPLQIGAIKPVIKEKIDEFVPNNPNASDLDFQRFLFKTMADELKNVQTSSEEVTVEMQLKKHGEDQWKIDDYPLNENFSNPFFSFY
ncbi:DUF5105 domain-containing protein [Metabacillus fastidiosus]|uniref:DUF5105 domain-containing protein n=1 Tax=Metabacillus fastidiosus TaxID=1458 RepID=UPI002E250240|nr:DUF5105 domain-containing protein [Metabacillus fastidiosus]